LNARSLPFLSVAGAVGLWFLLVGRLAGQSAPAAPALTLLSAEGRRTIPITLANEQEFVGLDDLASIFKLTVREDSLGAITVTCKGKTIVLTPDQALASVAGRLISLPAPPSRAGRRWLVPLEFISRALAPIYETRLDLRKPSRLLIAGDLRVPRVAIRYEALGMAARLTIDTTPRAAGVVSQEGDHLTIRFDADALDMAAIPAIAPQGLVQAVRATDPVTLAVDLGPRFAAFRASTQPEGDATAHLVVDVIAVQTEAAASPSPLPSPPPELPPTLAPGPAIRTIVVDPGHGGEDDGTKGADGTKEKDLTLAVARRLKAAIEARLGIRVLLTREDDRRLPLDDRAALANTNKADLLVSIHANASMRTSTTGAVIFYAAFAPEAEQPAHATAPERLPAFGGGSRDIEIVPWDMAQFRHLDKSAELARVLEQQLRGRVPLAPHPIERAPLPLLESANMPAVLVEMGFLSNPDQEKQLANHDFQNTLVQAVFDAVVNFRGYLEQTRQAAPAAPGAR
jgi:N-acetylmuramoyl-L-alanine amidase